MKNLNKKTIEEMKSMFSNLKVTEVTGGKTALKAVFGRDIGDCGHSCTGLSIDCWCEPHCASGISCTSGWY